MSDVALAVQAAIRQRLSAAALGHPVLTVVPDNLKPPATVISESSFEEIGSKLISLERHTVTVRTFIAGQSKVPLLEAMGRIKQALHNQPLTATGFNFSAAVQLQGTELRDVDEAVLVAEQIFQVIGQKL